jgi:hypothetical protein
MNSEKNAIKRLISSSLIVVIMLKSWVIPFMSRGSIEGLNSEISGSVHPVRPQDSASMISTATVAALITFGVVQVSIAIHNDLAAGSIDKGLGSVKTAVPVVSAIVSVNTVTLGGPVIVEST